MGNTFFQTFKGIAPVLLLRNTVPLWFLTQFFPLWKLWWSSLCLHCSKIFQWYALMWFYFQLLYWALNRPFILEINVLQLWRLFLNYFTNDFLLYAFFYLHFWRYIHYILYIRLPGLVLQFPIAFLLVFISFLLYFLRKFLTFIFQLTFLYILFLWWQNIYNINLLF